MIETVKQPVDSHLYLLPRLWLPFVFVLTQTLVLVATRIFGRYEQSFARNIQLIL